MICANFSGNMGDAIRIYIITRCVAKENDFEFGFNTVFHYDYHQGYNQLDFLDLDYGHIYKCGFDESPANVYRTWQEKSIRYNYPSGDYVDYSAYQDDIWYIKDGTRLIIKCGQDNRYFEKYKENICEWLKIKPEKELEYKEKLLDYDIELDENLTIINYRGGEFTGVPQLLVRPKYYQDAILEMLSRNKNMKFLVVSDDPLYAHNIFPNLDCVHLGIGCDYYILHNAHNLILSNSGFAIMPVYTNEVAKNIIGPKWWARHNVSTGYWASGETYYPGWEYLDRDGKLFSYADIYYEQHEKGLR